MSGDLGPAGSVPASGVRDALENGRELRNQLPFARISQCKTHTISYTGSGIATRNLPAPLIDLSAADCSELEPPCPGISDTALLGCLVLLHALELRQVDSAGRCLRNISGSLLLQADASREPLFLSRHFRRSGAV